MKRHDNGLGPIKTDVEYQIYIQRLRLNTRVFAFYMGGRVGAISKGQKPGRDEDEKASSDLDEAEHTILNTVSVSEPN